MGFNIKGIVSAIEGKSEIYKLLNSSKAVYKAQRLENGRVRSVGKAVKYGAKDLGAVNSIFAATGLAVGTFGVPFPLAGIVCAEGMLKLSRGSKYYIKKLMKMT